MHFRPLAAIALAGALVLGTVGTAFADGHHGPGGGGGFEDLGGAAWAQGAITLLASQGLVNGVTPTQFDPQGSITLAQLAAILMRYQGKVQASQPFSQQVQTAQQAGILQGIGNTQNLSAPATRAQAMAMIAAALNLQQGGNLGQEMSVLAHFHDGHAVPGWARKPLALAVQLGVLQGSAGDLLPEGDITRAELAVILQRIEALLGISPTVQGTTVQGTYVGTSAITSTTSTGSTTPQPTENIILDVPSSSSGSVTGSVYGSVYGNVYGSQESFAISPTAQIFLGNQPSTLSSFNVGDAVTLTLDSAGDAAVIDDTQGQQPQGVGVAGFATGTVTAISGNQITIGGPSGPGGPFGPGGPGRLHPGDGGDQGGGGYGNLGPGTYTLESSATVVVAGTAGTLSQVQPGDVVRLVVDQSGNVSTVIVLAQQQTVTGTLMFGSEDWLLVQTSSGPMRVLVDGHSTITLNGQPANLRDIAAGDQISAVGMMGEGGLAATQVTATGNVAAQGTGY